MTLTDVVTTSTEMIIGVNCILLLPLTVPMFSITYNDMMLHVINFSSL